VLGTQQNGAKTVPNLPSSHLVQRLKAKINPLEGRHYHISTAKLRGYGELPFTCLTASVPTVRPPDDVIIQNTEISGMDAFEEVVNPDELAALKDPFRERLMELVKAQGPT